MSQLLYFEMKKVLGMKKFLIVLAATVIFSVVSFQSINCISEFSNAQNNLKLYKGNVAENPIILEAIEKHSQLYAKYGSAENITDDRLRQEFLHLEYPCYLYNCDSHRKEILSDYGIKAKDLILGDTIFYGFIEQFIAPYFPWIISFLLAYLICPIFSSEYEVKMDSLLLSSSKGKKEVIISKFIVSFLIVMMFYIAIIGAYALLCLGRYGVGDMEASFVFTGDYVFNYISSPFEFTVGQYIRIMLVISFAGCIGLASFGCFLSSLFKNSILSTLIMLIIAVGPAFASQMLVDEDITKKLLLLTYTYIIGVRGEFGNMTTMSVAGTEIQFVYSALILLSATTIFFAFLAFKCFKKHQAFN